MIPSPKFEFGYHILKHTAIWILLSYWWLKDLGGQNPRLTLADCGGFFGMNCFDNEIFMWNLLDLETWGFHGWKVTLQAFSEMKVDERRWRFEYWLCWSLIIISGLRILWSRIKRLDYQDWWWWMIFWQNLLFEDYFATFARFEDVGLLWLDSHFARVFGYESWWSDCAKYC